MKDVYDAKKYASFSAKSFSWKYMEKPLIKRLLKNKIGNIKIIEAGCGDGRVVEFLIEMGAKEDKITGIDISRELVEIGKNKFPDVRWIKSSIGVEIGVIERGTTDLVISSMVLDYMDNEAYEKFLENGYKWLKKSGRLLITIPHPVRFKADKMEDYFVRGKDKNVTPWGETVYYFHRTVSDYINRVIKAGFEIEELIEMEVPEEAKVDDKEAYERYTRGPMRLAIWAKRK